MKRILSFTCVLALVGLTVSCSKENVADPTPAFVDEVSYRIITTDEAKQYFMHEKLHEQITPYFMDMALQKDSATREEWLDLTLRSMHGPMASRQAFLDSIATVQTGALRSMGISLPLPKQIDVIDMTMDAFGGATAFTSGTRIYADIPVILNAQASDPSVAERLMWHELWHVISRNNPDLRKQMFSLIGFHVLPDEIEIPEEVKSHVLCNPDVERHDSYATFTINGKATDCMLLLYAEEDEYSFFTLASYISTAKGYWLLALDPVTHKPYRDEKGEWAIYNCKEATDFATVMSGGNTLYCDDPEECMAENFAFAMVNDTSRPNQKLLQDIREMMKQLTNRPAR